MLKFSNPRQKKNLFAAICFLAPNFLGFVCFTAGPVFLSLYMSFTNWSLMKAVKLQWVGLRNYHDLLTDPDFWFYLYNTFYFMLGIPFGVFGSLFLANLLADSMQIKNLKKRTNLALLTAIIGFISVAILFAGGSKDLAMVLTVVFIGAVCGILYGSMTYRTMFYIPSFASGVATIILWTQVFNPHFGMANTILGHIADVVGYTGTLPKWLVSKYSLLGFLPLPHFIVNDGFGLGAREAIIIMGIWMGIGGNNMILYIAAISNIPDSIYEAADIDGAGSFHKFIHITIPSVAPTTFFIMIMSVIGGLQGGFQFAKIMTQGGPAGMTTTLAYYIYTAGFEDLRFGYASAVSWILFVIVFTCTLINWKYGNRRMEM